MRFELYLFIQAKKSVFAAQTAVWDLIASEIACGIFITHAEVRSGVRDAVSQVRYRAHFIKLASDYLRSNSHPWSTGHVEAVYRGFLRTHCSRLRLDRPPVNVAV